MRTASLVILGCASASAPGPPVEPELRDELLALVQADQQARGSLVVSDNGMLVGPPNAVEDIDRKTTARMKEVIARHGWPGRQLVGDDGAEAAWLLVQHADADVAFQQRCLYLMIPAVAVGDVSPANFAYLYDRVALHTGRLQRYGTQFFDGDRPQPIEDPERIDERRAAVGLGTLEEGKRALREKYGL